MVFSRQAYGRINHRGQSSDLNFSLPINQGSLFTCSSSTYRQAVTYFPRPSWHLIEMQGTYLLYFSRCEKTSKSLLKRRA